MAEPIEQTSVTQETQTSPEIPTQSVIVKKSHAGLWLAILALTLVLVVAGAGFYYFQQIQISQTTDNSQDNEKMIAMEKRFLSIQEQISGLQSQLSTVNSEMTGKDNHFNQTLADFSKLHEEHLETARKELETQIITLQRQLSKTRGDWLLADAEYMLTVANQRLNLLGDVYTARQALESADQRLRESGYAPIYKIREQIAKEIALLVAIEATDIVGFYAELQRMQESVENLAVFLPHAGKQSDTTSNSAATTNENELPQGFLGSIARALKGYVVLRNTSQPVNSILTPEEAVFIKQQMKVRLEMIKMALVQQNDTLLTTSVADAQQWLKTNFAEDAATRQLYTDLERLGQTPIRSQYPDISNSLKQLKEFNQVHRVEPEKPAPQQPPAEAPAATSSSEAAKPASVTGESQPAAAAPANSDATSTPAPASEAQHP